MPDDVMAISALTLFAKDACSAEGKLIWMSEVYREEQFLKNFLEAIKILPGSISTVEAIVERYSNKANTTAPGASFLDRVRHTLPRVAADNREVFEVPRSNASPTNPFYLGHNKSYQRRPSTPGESAYTIRPQDHTATSQALSDASFYKDLAKASSWGATAIKIMKRGGLLKYRSSTC
ncbi:hypothetical protein Daus18300_002270 [Diaporthe australafricana]|uniref:Uncharacterized protein n=1 Tax=Diaporthe australafricana TaxID=127596 RepID=A0ABR3XQW0_9PEZI